MFVGRFFQYAMIKREPRQLAIDKAVWGAGVYGKRSRGQLRREEILPSRALHNAIICTRHVPVPQSRLLPISGRTLVQNDEPAHGPRLRGIINIRSRVSSAYCFQNGLFPGEEKHKHALTYAGRRRGEPPNVNTILRETTC